MESKKEYIIKGTLDEHGDNCNPKFYMRVIWKEAQKEIKDKLRAVLDGGGTSESFIEDLEEILKEEA